ncbi:MAG: hypothetical protein PHR88_01510 [Proteiniphilum sp.]|jgi:hypothetical protein|nr:hypothetical protein [Proteiniphilum sp.]
MITPSAIPFIHKNPGGIVTSGRIATISKVANRSEHVTMGNHRKGI